MPQLSKDPHFADTTILTVTVSPPRREHDLPELGALVLRFAGFGYIPTGDGLRCVPDPSSNLARTIERSGLRPEQVRGRAPAAVALAYLDTHLTRPPYLVATHGPQLGQLIAAHRDSCPVLADLPILDTARLASYLFPGADPRLGRWADRLDTSGISSRIGEQTRLAAALFMHLMHEVLRREDPHDLAALIRIAGVERLDSRAPREPAPGVAVRPAGHEGRLAWTAGSA